MSRRGKKYRQAKESFDHTQEFAPEEAVGIAKETSYANFDATIEAHLRMGLDPRKADQQVRSTVSLPHGTGRQIRVLVFAQGEGEMIAREAGADYVGSDEFVQKIQDGWFDFDVTVATPPMMSKVGRLGRLLGPRGLMPSPKAGTVVPDADLGRVIKELKAGRVEFRLDKTANIHVPIGKTSFSAENLLENLTALMEAIMQARPDTVKGAYIRRAVLCGTMGPSVKIDITKAMQLKSA